MEIRWNLVIFGINLLVLLGVVIWFAKGLLTPEVVYDNHELIIGGVLAVVTTTVGFVGGYATGVQQALTAPSDPAPTITEAFSS